MVAVERGRAPLNAEEGFALFSGGASGDGRPHGCGHSCRPPASPSRNGLGPMACWLNPPPQLGPRVWLSNALMPAGQQVFYSK